MLVVLANAAVDTTTHANATAVKTLCCETLALLTVSDEGTEAALRAATTAAMKKTLQSESAQEMPGGVLLKAAATRCLKNICQHGVGKIKAFEMDVLAVILPLLRSKDTDLRLQATGTLSSSGVSQIPPPILRIQDVNHFSVTLQGRCNV